MTGRERPSESDDCPVPDLERLTLSEKVGQLVGAYVGSMGDTELSVDDAAALVRDEGVGTIAAFGIGISPHRDPLRVAEIANRLQRVAIEETRHGIPLLLPVDAVHGHAYVDGATVFPHGLGVAATRNPANARLAGEITAAEMRATGANLNYGPTCDVARDPRWGRTFETFGESPLLCGAFAGATVRGLESEADGPRVAATAKHFPAYGDPAGGEDAAAVDRSASTLHRLFLPPFARAIDAGASVVMPCYNSIDGEPAHGSRRYLTELLRERLGFDGAVASDWGGIDHLHEDHRVTASQRDSARTAVDAGLDLISIGRDEYTAHIRDLVESGDLSEARIDDAVARILELKASLGLFEDPYVDIERVRTTVGASAHRRAALQAARESQTLLENDGVLPLADDLDSILVAGPNADSLRNQYGGWSVQDPDPDSGTTVLEGIADRAGDETTVRYERGATVGERADLEAVADAAADADVAVVAVGEGWYYHEFGPKGLVGSTGEFPTRSRLELPAAQRDLLEAVHETGTPLAVVAIAGRPLALSWTADNADALLYSYYPGSEGGEAIADVLFGDVDPAGRLPISVPRSAGDLPSAFNHVAHPTPIGADEHPDTYDPLYAFGDGESYTEFACSDLSVADSRIGSAESITASVTVENVGDRPGDRAVDCFLRDDVSSRVRPVREHVGFARVSLEPGESTTAEMTIPNDALAVTDSRGRTTVEPGSFTLSCDGRSTTVTVERSDERSH
ncbi:glycoside hydrolase family 3 N-terminal domain-containing protein [Natrinema amylolyticum]|uniref:glycoside hydrolase family 3 N-terminal domain-containing protein n=1 Tax=Natrinema amylolyticum TaxID=2878679 RepID=UPI001CF952D3|nr:glycoside hydrolase family 3 N-terminal domain-containing protein [Natrinema amylolyticum]